MERKQIALPWGGRVAIEGGWSGRLRGAYLAPRSLQISHVLVQRGLLGRTEPFKLDNARQQADGILILHSQTQGNAAPGRGSVPFTAKTLVHCSGGASVPLSGLVLDRQRLRVEYLLVGSDGDARAVPMRQVDKLASGSPSIALNKAALENLPCFRSDAEAHQNAQAALERADPSGDIFLAVHVQVVDWTAHMTGHVRLPVQKEDAEKAVARAKGVLNVQNAIATDWDICLAVAEAVAREGLMRQGLVTVQSSLGRVRLGGHLGSHELVDEAVAIATGVAGVRSVAHDIQVRPLPVPEPAEAVAETP